MKPKEIESPPKSIGQLVDYSHELREQIRVLTKKVDELKAERDNVDAQMLEMMDQHGLARASGSLATATVTESVVGHVNDWDRFYGYIRRAKAFHLLERRVANGAYREVLASNAKVPGVEPFTKRSIGLRTL